MTEVVRTSTGIEIANRTRTIVTDVRIARMENIYVGDWSDFYIHANTLTALRELVALTAEWPGECAVETEETGITVTKESLYDSLAKPPSFSEDDGGYRDYEHFDW